MSKRRNSRRRGSDGAAEDDAQLWHVYSKRIDPLNLKLRVPDTDTDLFDDMLREEASRASDAAHKPLIKPGKGLPKGLDLPAVGASPARPATVAPRAVVRTIDTKEVRRIGKGRKAIDARIDLHGMRQHEAHAALRVFLFRAVAKGHRLVLVITGKGTTELAHNAGEVFGAFINEGAPGRGVLRRNVPMWLDEPDLRAVVVGYTTAHIRHGGDGALYIQVRRSRSSTTSE